MKTKTRAQILEIITKTGSARPHDLIQSLGITAAAVHRHLKRLCQEGQIERVGNPPQVFYRLREISAVCVQQVSGAHRDFLQKHYLYVDPTGQMLEGLEGLFQWAQDEKQRMNFSALVEEYIGARRVIGFAIVNSYKGFEVVREI